MSLKPGLSLLSALTLVLAGFTGLAACGGDDDGGGGTIDAAPGTPDADTTMTDAGNPLGTTTTLTIEPFDVQPGTERQVCKKVNLPAGADIDIVRMHSTMVGTSHHFNVYKSLEANNTAPVSAADAMVHDCSPAADQLNGDAAYIFGAALPERTVDMPAGIAFHFVAGQVLILEQHVINSGDSVIQGGVTFDIIGAGAGANIEHHADIMWFANWAIYLPPSTMEQSIKEHCTVPYDVQVFGLMSHTHHLGTTFTIDKWANGTSDHLYDNTDWAHPLYKDFTPTFSLVAGEGLEWTCTYLNTTEDAVTAGQNSTDEMCMTFAYVYPTNSLDADPIQCNKPFAP